MSGPELGLVASVFLACTVEAVEALTIVLAVGATRSWSAALSGVAGALVVLGVLVGVFGPALTALPINLLRAVIGGVLLVFGLQWLRKAILRASGLKPLHDEAAIFASETTAARALGGASPGFDGYAFTVAFKGVLLEGLEVAFIVITFGANQHHIPLALLAAALAIAVVVAAGVAVRKPLARVPENTLKFFVGVMLTAFGMFWAVEGAGASWPGSDTALLVILPSLICVSLAFVILLRRGQGPPASTPPAAGAG
jgi:uncharacterized membrane protein